MPHQIETAREPAPVAVEPGVAGRVAFEVETEIPTAHGPFRFRVYRDRATGDEHLAIVSLAPVTQGALVRVHSECLTGEVFASEKCECGPQLDAALERIADGGVVVYLRGHEGRGIGLVAKLKAYRLQQSGLDTLDANLALGLPADDREYAAAAAILDDLGLHSVRLLTNNPDKITQLTGHGIEVVERVPLVTGAAPANLAYLRAKRDRMGHLIPADT
ncbi:3,4-dihydroxy 2-butanone 4-phosphate synthase/GTP cyclohydrolase II [Agromyces hippuratus]|uniref:GTP cyclohydrolase-2 n=1 Tax=Agromyces hippuratus TaxID=286438 RepID=A0A852WV34_9MICO|nr:3,4-dihydroxy 2-butanone 4-phosphate synthase/GTP cyclohydrolase II [Agromyces hippuratus]